MAVFICQDLKDEKYKTLLCFKVRMADLPGERQRWQVLIALQCGGSGRPRHQLYQPYLRVGKEGETTTGIYELLEEQFPHAGIEVIGIQEGRSKTTQQKDGHSYVMLTAAAYDDGASGVQIWVMRGIQVRIWNVLTPRIMFAIISKKGVDMGFICAHAPHMKAGEEIKQKWWVELDNGTSKLLARYKVSWTCLIDSNGRTGSV